MIEAIYEIDVPHGVPASHVGAEYVARLALQEARDRHPGIEPARVDVKKTAATGRWTAHIFYPDDAAPC